MEEQVLRPRSAVDNYGSVESQPLGASGRAGRPRRRWYWAAGVVLLAAPFVFFLIQLARPPARNVGGCVVPSAPIEGSAWPAMPDPFSTVSPMDLGFLQAKRTALTMPGQIFGDLRLGARAGHPLPTNTWYQNMLMHDDGGRYNAAENKAYTIPYVVDTAVRDVGSANKNDSQTGAGTIPNGLRVHHPHLIGSERIVQLAYDERAALQIGSLEAVEQQIVAASQPTTELALTLEWASSFRAGAVMRTPIVRGMALVTMEYEMLTPLISAQMMLSGRPIVDGKVKMECVEESLSGATPNEQSVTVQSHVELHFRESDFTWLVFFSKPTPVQCSQSPVGIGKDFFRLEASDIMRSGVVRVALVNNCTTGSSADHCDDDSRGKGRDQAMFTDLVLRHKSVYPTGASNVQFIFPVEGSAEEKLTLGFDWRVKHMDPNTNLQMQTMTAAEMDRLNTQGECIEPLMYALPHHVEDMQWSVGSTNLVSDFGCLRTMHGISCPVSGGRWTMTIQLHGISFSAPRAIRHEMKHAIERALHVDIDYDVAENFRRGAGDTYFSGKQLAKLARIIVIADEVGFDKTRVKQAVHRLTQRCEIWLNGSAESPLLYDNMWGGMVSCGCTFDEQKRTCVNSYPECPALTNPGQNFGHGYYNDHHFHYGYHIYAAAVASKFDPDWGKKYFQHVLTLIRDIANPSKKDLSFHPWRHKDWFLGSSWASGIANIGGKPYPNGRNQESSSEAVAAYEAVALYGSAMASIFGGAPWGLPATADAKNATVSQQIRDLGRVLLAMEVRTAKRYWHVVKGRYPGPFDQIYPDVYKPYAIDGALHAHYGGPPGARVGAPAPARLQEVLQCQSDLHGRVLENFRLSGGRNRWRLEAGLGWRHEDSQELILDGRREWPLADQFAVLDCHAAPGGHKHAADVGLRRARGDGWMVQQCDPRVRESSRDARRTGAKRCGTGAHTSLRARFCRSGLGSRKSFPGRRVLSSIIYVVLVTHCSALRWPPLLAFGGTLGDPPDCIAFPHHSEICAHTSATAQWHS
eukprot:scaffold1627_cov238-Pinguiococcus_pyrenoidosus.AAC.11